MRTASFLLISVALHAAALAYPVLHNAPEKAPPLIVSIIEAEGGGGGGENSSAAEKPRGGRAADAPPHKPIKHAALSNATPPRAVSAAPVEAPRSTEPAPIAAPAEPVALPVVETQAQSVISVPVRENAVTVALESGASSSRGTAAIDSSNGSGSSGGGERGSGSGTGAGSGSGAGFGSGQGDGNGAARFVEASYMSCPKADYPEAAKREGREGMVMVLVVVDEEGRPKSSRVFESSGVASLDRAAVDNVQRRCRFHPAKRGANRVETMVKIPVEFRLADSNRR